MPREEVLRIEDLKTYYYTLGGVVKAVDGVDLHVDKGELVALVGESGCGKSTLAFSIMRMVPPPGRIVGGHIYLTGLDVVSMSPEEVRKIRWSKVSMVFQGAMNSLNPVMKVGDQIIEAMLYHDAISTPEEGRSTVKHLFELVGLDPNRIDSYPHELSGGMKQRVVIAMAMSLNPDLIIADEPTTALDVTTQAKIMEVLRDVQKKTGVSILLITHDLPLVAEVSDRVYIMYAGKIVETGSVFTIFKAPRHPYTQGLIGAVPSIRGPKKKLVALPGEPPDLRFPPPGCRFHPRCSKAMDICSREEPPRIEFGPDEFVSCWLYAKGEEK